MRDRNCPGARPITGTTCRATWFVTCNAAASDPVIYPFNVHLGHARAHTCERKSNQRERERERGTGTLAVSYIAGRLSSVREQKAQDKLDNLAAKPFFSRDYQPELAPFSPFLSFSLSLPLFLSPLVPRSLFLSPSRANGVAQPSFHFPQTIPTSWLLPAPSGADPRCPPRCSALFSLALSRARAEIRSPVVWHPRSLE